MRHIEDHIQQDIVSYMRLKHPGVPFTCSPGTSRSAREGAKKKRMGYWKGWPDLFFAVPNKGFSGLFIELKTETGRIEKDQQALIETLNKLGYHATICRSYRQAIETIEQYLNWGEK